MTAQVDRLERDDFIAKIETAPPHTSDERRLLIKSIAHADYRLIGGRVEKYEPVEGLGGDPEEAFLRRWKRI